MHFSYREMKACSFGPQIRHAWQVTFIRPRFALMLFTRTTSYWCVGLSWYGVGKVRDLTLHLAAVSISLRLWVPSHVLAH